MEIVSKYVVYELSPVMDSTKSMCLEKARFKGWTQNTFDSEAEAIRALVDNEMTYQDYLIIKQVFIRS